MVVLEFDVPASGSVLGRSWVKALKEDAKSISSTQMLYKMFYAQVDFSVGTIRFITKSSFVALVDLAIRALRVANDLVDGVNSAIGFAEHDEIIKFRLDGETVVVSSSVKNDSASAGRMETVAVLRSFALRAYESIVTFYPALSENSTVARLREAG